MVKPAKQSAETAPSRKSQSSYWVVPTLLLAWAIILLVPRIPEAVKNVHWIGAVLARFPALSLSGLGWRFLGHGKTIAVALGLAGVLALCGTGLLAWLRVRGASGVLYRCLAFPLGFGAVSLALFGLLLTGLWFPGVMAGALALVFLASRPWLSWKSVVPRRSPEAGMAGPIGYAVVASLVLFIPWMLIPEVHPDAWTYHLAGPDRWLAAQGVSTRMAAAPLMYPFLSELPSAFALILDEDAVPKFWHGLWLLCGIRAFMGAVDERMRGWGLLGGLASASTVYIFGAAKNEGVGAALALLAFSCLMGETGPLRWSRLTATAGVLVGFLFSYKYLGSVNAAWVLVAAVILRGVRGWKWFGYAAVIAAVTAGPWYLKNLVLTGDPAFPQLVIRFPRWFEGFDERATQVAANWIPWQMEAMTPTRLIGLLQGENSWMLWALPLTFIVGGRIGGVVSAVSVLFTVLLAHAFNTPQTMRWFMPTILPAVLVASASAGRWLGGLPGGWRRIMATAAGVVMLVAMFSRFTGQFNTTSPFPYLLGGEGRETVRRAERSALVDLAGCLRGYPGQGVLLVGDFSEYRLPKPVRLNYQAESGEPAFLWKAVGSSSTAGEILKKFREAGISLVAYNPLRAENNCAKYLPYGWTDAMILLYRDFWGRYAEQVCLTPGIDQRNGIFYLYRFRDRPLPASPAYVNHLPGTEDLMARALHARIRQKKYAVAVAGFESLQARFPRVGLVESQMAQSYLLVGENEKAYRIFRDVVARGLVDDLLIATYGMVCVERGKFEEAIAAYRKNAEYDHDMLAETSQMLVLAQLLSAWEMVQAGKVSQAEGRIREAFASAGELRTEIMSRELAFLHLLKALILMRSGNMAGAVPELKQAEPELPNISRVGRAQLEAVFAPFRENIQDQMRKIMSGNGGKM